MKQYRLTLPTEERCTEIGVKNEGMEVRTRLWLMGVAHGIAFSCGKVRFNVIHIPVRSEQFFTVECNSEFVMEQVKTHLTQYGVTVTEEALTPA